MAKLESSMKNMVMSLTFIALVASALLAGAYALTKQPIEQAKLANQQQAIKDVLADKTAAVEQPVQVQLEGYTDAFVVYPTVKDGQTVGVAVETYNNTGYGGRLKVMVGMDKTGTVTGYTVLETSETPGLGAKAAEWFKDKGNIVGKNPKDTKFVVTKDGGDIDAITASTITSRAFLTAVQCAYDAFMKSQNQ